MSGGGLTEERKWPSGVEWAVAELAIPVAALAEQLAVPLETWEEDGLGASAGVWLALAEGHPVLLLERLAARAGCTTVWMDAGQASRAVPAAVIRAVLAATELSVERVSWRPEDDAAWRQEGATLAARAARPWTGR